jgi:predicted metalloenzyme YecM
MISIQNFQNNATEYLNLLENFLTENDLLEKVFVDHIGYDSGSNSEYETLREVLEQNSCFIHQVNISERRIAVAKLAKEISTTNFSTPYIELADQKTDDSQTEGFDHIEIHPKNISFDELVSLCESKRLGFKKKERPHHVTYDLRISNNLGIKLTSVELSEKIKDEM